MNIGDWIVKWSRITPDKTAIMDDEQEFSYKELNDRCNRLTNYLLKQGVGKGDRIAIISHNCHQFMEIFFASSKVGAVFVPLNWRMAVTEIVGVLNDCSPKFIFFEGEFSDLIISVREKVEHIERYIGLGDHGLSWADAYDDIESFPATEPFGLAPTSFEDPHIILYTSGTTGEPKGAILSIRKAFYNTLNANIFFGLTPADIFLVSRPLFHSGGLLIDSLPTLYKGATVMYKRRFSTREYLEAVVRYQVTISEPAATFLNFLLKESDYDLSSNLRSLRSFYTGGERVPPTLIKAYHEKGLPLSQLFGMTETSTVTWLPAEYTYRKIGSVGKPVFHGEVKIVNKEGNEVAPGETGEILVGGPILMSGYWNKPEQTKECIKEGWLYTGDLATVDDEGFIYIIDRSKDTYISGGENIHPAEVEKSLLTNPKIFDVAVYGVPDEKWGEVGKASIVLKDGQQMTQDEVLAFLDGRIGKYKIPKHIEFIKELPMTATGKIKRYVLIEAFKAGLDQKEKA
ncbi:MAG: AMP-binding protein [Deltaproteobacteria bacterium]|nr:AMP-binding protein [Deltaproteobacteria bacterium]